MSCSHGGIDQLYFIDRDEDPSFRLALEVGVVLIGTVVIARVGVQFDPEVLAVLAHQPSRVPDGAPFQVRPSLEDHPTSQLNVVYWGGERLGRGNCNVRLEMSCFIVVAECSLFLRNFVRCDFLGLAPKVGPQKK